MDKLEAIEHNYEDILYLEYPSLLMRPRQSINVRAAQFSPFAALTGLEDQMREEVRIVDKRKIIDEGISDELNSKLNFINNNINKNIVVSITYFIRDNKKNGGRYEIHNGIIRRIDMINRVIIFYDKTTIAFNDIVYIKVDDL